MSLVRNIASLATRIALELKAARQRIGALEGRLPPGETVVTPGHPGVAKAWGLPDTLQRAMRAPLARYSPPPPRR